VSKGRKPHIQSDEGDKKGNEEEETPPRKTHKQISKRVGTLWNKHLGFGTQTVEGRKLRRKRDSVTNWMKKFRSKETETWNMEEWAKEGVIREKK